MIEQIGGSRHAAAELADEAALAGPVVSQRPPKMIVPLRPAGGKAADLIATGTDIPWLGNKLHSGQGWILPDRRKKWRAAIKAG